HAPADALQLAVSLVPWWWLRGRLAEAHEGLTAAAAPFSPACDAWVAAQLWLGHLSAFTAASADAIEGYTMVLDAYEGRRPSRMLLGALIVASVVWSWADNIPEGAQAARRAISLVDELDDAAAEVIALTARAVSAYREGDGAGAVDCARRAEGLLARD